jgi:hypothetical protein
MHREIAAEQQFDVTAISVARFIVYVVGGNFQSMCKSDERNHTVRHRPSQLPRPVASTFRAVRIR